MKNKEVKVYNTIKSKSINKLTLNLYFIGTYAVGVTMLYPFIEKFIKATPIHGITNEQLVLFIIFSITQILNTFDYKTFKIKNLIQKDVLFNFISQSYKKVIDAFTDLLGYVAISTPILLIITEYISTNNIDMETIPIKLIIIGCGAIIFIIKSVVETICVYEKKSE